MSHHLDFIYVYFVTSRMIFHDYVICRCLQFSIKIYCCFGWQQTSTMFWSLCCSEKCLQSLRPSKLVVQSLHNSIVGRNMVQETTSFVGNACHRYVEKAWWDMKRLNASLLILLKLSIVLWYKMYLFVENKECHHYLVLGLLLAHMACRPKSSIVGIVH